VAALSSGQVQLAGSWAFVGNMAGSTAMAAAGGAGRVLIPSYARTTLHKTWIGQSAEFWSTAGANSNQLFQLAGRWRSTAAVSRLDVFPAAGNFIIGSEFSLYGLK
jgi:hypothetical protein